MCRGCFHHPDLTGEESEAPKPETCSRSYSKDRGRQASVLCWGHPAHLPPAPPVLRPLLRGTLLESLIRLFSQIPCLCPVAPERVDPSRDGPCRLSPLQCFLPPLHLSFPSPDPTKSTVRAQQMVRNKQSLSAPPSAQTWTSLRSFAFSSPATRLVMELSYHRIPSCKEFQPASSLTPLFGSRRRRVVQNHTAG